MTVINRYFGVARVGQGEEDEDREYIRTIV